MEKAVANYQRGAHKNHMEGSPKSALAPRLRSHISDLQVLLDEFRARQSEAGVAETVEGLERSIELFQTMLKDEEARHEPPLMAEDTDTESRSLHA